MKEIKIDEYFKIFFRFLKDNNVYMQYINEYKFQNSCNDFKKHYLDYIGGVYHFFDKDFKNDKDYCLSHIIGCSFVWSKSRKGVAYWCALNNDFIRYYADNSFKIVV